MPDPTPYTIVFDWPDMPTTGAGPTGTAYMENGVLPPVLVDPIDWSGAPVKGTWELTGKDDTKLYAFYLLKS